MQIESSVAKHKKSFRPVNEGAVVGLGYRNETDFILGQLSAFYSLVVEEDPNFPSTGLHFPHVQSMEKI